MPQELRQSRIQSSRFGSASRVAERYTELPAWQVVALCGVLFALVFLIRTGEDSPAIGVHLFYIVPVILLALRFGGRGGILGALFAIALFLVYTLTDDDDAIDVSTWISPAFSVLIVGGMVGYLSGKLQHSEHRFRTAAENQLEPFALYSTVRDDEGRIVDFQNVFINDVGAASVGMTREQMHGKLLSELFPGRLEHGLLDQYARVVETGEPYFSEAVDYINVLGHQELVRAFDIRISKLDGGIEITWRDITERKRAERERDWLAAIVEHASDAVLSVDLDGMIVSWSGSAEQLYGYSRDEAIGRSYELLVHKGENSKRRDYLERVLAGERPGPIESVDICKDGSEVQVSFVGWPILDADGEVIGAARIVRRAGD